MNLHRGDIVLVLFPDSNLRTAKRRPAMVVQADELGSGLAQTIVAMITSNMQRAGSEPSGGSSGKRERERVGTINGLGDNDGQPRDDSRIGD